MLSGAVLAATTGPAQAATPLSSWVPVATSAASTAYTVTTSLPYWSVVGVKPPSTADYDLSVTPNGSSSAAGWSIVDFVAIDTNVCAGATRTATVTRWSGSGAATVEWANQHQVLTGWFGVVQTSFGPNPTTGYASVRVGQNA